MKNLLIFTLATTLLLGCTVSSHAQRQPIKERARSADDIYLIVGTYTKKKSEGIYTFTFNEASGTFAPVDTVKGIDNPSFLDVAPNSKFVYAVNETNGGSVQAFSFSKGTLKPINVQPSGGAHPCHVAIDATGKWCIVGNYTGGSLAILPINNDGSLSAPKQVIQHTGSGPKKGRQNEPHVHSVNISPNNSDVFVPDLGIDKVMAYRLNDKTGVLTPGNHQTVSAGSGPRHFTFHPTGKFAYVIQELSSTITAFDYTDGKLTEIEEVLTIPKDFKGKNFCADIHISPDGKYLYGSNRYYDRIVAFEINQKTGKLKMIQEMPVFGEVPRNFTISPSGKWLLVANQDSDNIIIFSRNTYDGSINPSGRQIRVSMPVCLKWAR